MRIAKTKKERVFEVLSRVKKTNSGCWEYNHCFTSDGYGIVKVGGRKGKQYLAHRLLYEHFHGPIEKGLFICHKCDNPPCINPDHLFSGTNRENQIDSKNKGRASYRAYSKELVKKVKYSLDSRPVISKNLNLTLMQIKYIKSKRCRAV